MPKVILLMLLALPGNSVLAEWGRLDGGDVHQNTYANPATLRKNGNQVKMWSLSDFKVAQERFGKTFLSSKRLVEYDCKEDQVRLLAYAWYSGNMGEGELVYSNADHGKWLPVVAESVDEHLWEMVCGKR